MTTRHKLFMDLSGRVPTLTVAVDDVHVVELQLPSLLLPELGTIGCRTGSGLVLPGPWSHWRHFLRPLLAGAKLAVQKDATLCITAHTGPDDPANTGKARVNMVRSLIEGDPESFASIAIDSGSLADVKGYFAHLHRKLRWLCAIESSDIITDDDDEDSRRAVRLFQLEYKHRFRKDILVDGICGEQTLRAIHAVLTYEFETWCRGNDVDRDLSGARIEYWDSTGCTGQRAPTESALMPWVVPQESFGSANPSVELLYSDVPVNLETYPEDSSVAEDVWVRVRLDQRSHRGDVTAVRLWSNASAYDEQIQVANGEFLEEDLVDIMFSQVPVGPRYTLAVVVGSGDSQVVIGQADHDRLSRDGVA